MSMPKQDHPGAHIATVAAVVGVPVDVGLAARAGAGDGAVVGHACLPAVGAEAGVVRLAVAAQVAGLCTAHSMMECATWPNNSLSAAGTEARAAGLVGFCVAPLHRGCLRDQVLRMWPAHVADLLRSIGDAAVELCIAIRMCWQNRVPRGHCKQVFPAGWYGTLPW